MDLFHETSLQCLEFKLYFIVQSSINVSGLNFECRLLLYNVAKVFSFLSELHVGIKETYII